MFIDIDSLESCFWVWIQYVFELMLLQEHWEFFLAFIFNPAGDKITTINDHDKNMYSTCI